MEIRILARRGMTIRAIARELSISRNTVRRYLRGEALREVGRRGPGRPRKLAPYEDWLRRRVEARLRAGFRRRCCTARSRRWATRGPSARCVGSSRDYIVCERPSPVRRTVSVPVAPPRLHRSRKRGTARLPALSACSRAREPGWVFPIAIDPFSDSQVCSGSPLRSN